MRGRRGLLAALVGGVVVVAVVVAALVVPRLAPGRGDSATVTVMTRNLYLGADINRPVRAAAGRNGGAALAAFGRANAAVRATVDRTDAPVRSRLLAAEIAAARPDLVGLQEVALWRSGPLELDRIGVPNATTVDLDFLELLRTELANQRAAYEVVQVQPEADVEGPAFPELGRDVRLTLRDVILVRADAGVTVRDRGSGQYRARLTVDLAGAGFAYVRGYAWADVEVAGARLRVVTSHLESDRADITQAQAEELLAGPVASAGDRVVLLCDCNSPAEPPGSAYAVLTGPAGLRDTWTGGPGATFGLSETVDDPAPTFARRIDLVLARGVTPERGEVVGDEPADRDPATGLWPSDHAGVVTTLRIR